MTKYDFNFKMKVVKSYLDEEDGLGSIAKQYGIDPLVSVNGIISKIIISKYPKVSLNI